MIVSHQYRYLFIEVPHTASTAISRELVEQYNGSPIRHKHATYREFLQTATPEEKKYFIFGGVRNPLDMLVSVYFKLKTNHRGHYTDEKYWMENGGHVSALARRQYRFIKETNCNFSGFFTHFYNIPFDSWGSPRPGDFNYVIRFEYLQEDFAKLLELLGIRQVRPLPLVNKTSDRDKDYRTYYSTEAIKKARWVLGPYMDTWGYNFPKDWGYDSSHWFNRLQFSLLGALRRHLMWRSTPTTRMLRWLRFQFHHIA